MAEQDLQSKADRLQVLLERAEKRLEEQYIKNEEVAKERSKGKELLIWTNMGRTLMFKNVTNFIFHSQGFEFDYKGVSTGRERHANFNNTSVSGYALTN